MGQNVLIDGEVSHLVHDWCEIRGSRTGGRGYSPPPPVVRAGIRDLLVQWLYTL